MTPPKFSVVVPTYNANKKIFELVVRLQDVFENVIMETYEILIVDDGSSCDYTCSSLSTLSSYRNVSVIKLTRNFGKPGAVMCGLSFSKGDLIVTIDDDLQQRPEDIPLLVKKSNHDVVSATHSSKKHTRFQRITSLIKQRFDRILLGQRGGFSPLKLISRPIVNGMLEVQTNHPFIPALIHQCTSDIVFVETDHMESIYGKSRYSFSRRLSQFSNLIIGNSDIMLRSFSIAGYTSAFLSVLLLITVIFRKLIGFPVSAGWSSLMVAILAIGGLNMAAVGLTGQYFIRILDVASKKPAFLVRSISVPKEILPTNDDQI